MGRALRLRNWAFASAAFDLALRQAGRSLHDVLGLQPRPVRFVNSLGLGKEPSIEPVRRRLARAPGVRFELDAEATWARALVDEVAATGAARHDRLRGGPARPARDRAAAWRYLERVSYDSPIRSAEDIGATPLAARGVNVKPARIGSLRALFDVYARCWTGVAADVRRRAWASWA